MRTVYIISALLLSIMLTVPLNAAVKKSKNKKSPAKIKADKMHYLKEEGCMVAENNVVVTLDDQTLSADKVVAYQKTGKDGKQDFSKIVATGDVVIKTPERTLTGQKAVWKLDERKGTVRFTGSPVVREKTGHEIAADVIKYDIATGKCTFEGSAKARMDVSDDNKLDFNGF